MSIFIIAPKFKRKSLGLICGAGNVKFFFAKIVCSNIRFRPVPVPEGSQFALLQKKAELSKFTEEFLVSEAMKMSDREYELYVEKKHARAEGLEEGRAEGRAEGREEGRAEGRAEGADAKAREMALAMLMDNEPIEKIVKYSGLSEKDTRELRRLQTDTSRK